MAAAATGEEQRVHRRSMCSEIVEIVFQDQNGREIRESGLLEDVSPAGACITLALPLGVDRSIRVRKADYEGVARVRHCQIGAEGFVVGVEFEAGQSWDERFSSAQHLYSPPEE